MTSRSGWASLRSSLVLHAILVFSFVFIGLWSAGPAHAQSPCVVPDNGGGTVDLPPAGCGYVSPADLHEIISGLPPGTTIQVAAQHERFFNITRSPGGSLGGEVETSDSFLNMQLTGTGGLSYNRSLTMPAAFETHVAPRTPGAEVQSFDTDMFRLQGQLPPGDPDFDLLRITAGTTFDMPSPGHTTLTRQPGGNWNVDSFFDITYRIDFVGAPGGPFSGMSGSTTGTIRMQGGVPAPPPPPPPCVVPDNGSGTVDLPPVGCAYVSPADLHRIIDGLPPGTTINVAARHERFFNVTRSPGGSLGGEVETSDSSLNLQLSGTGGLAGYNRLLGMPAAFETHVGPRTPGDPVQSFDTDMFRLQGQLPPGDPDFDLLRITAGTGLGMPSPGHTTLTLQPGGTWNVDSFFDITYRIDFVGAPGGPLAGMSGSTTGTIRMTAAGGGCADDPAICDDQNPCTQDTCNPFTGQCEHLPVDCNDNDPCTVDRCEPQGSACSVPDNGGGTATLPPKGCGYVSPADLHRIIEGLPAGSTIEVAAVHRDFVCPAGGSGGVCSFVPPAPGVDCDEPGGSLGGEMECADSILGLSLTGTGGLAGYNRNLDMPISFETHTAPRTPGDPVQSFDTDMFRLFGQITGDPDFDLLRITSGTDFGLPSPGHTTLTQQAGGTWAVDSFFDITYRIDFVGAPGGPLSGMSGSTTGTIRMSTGGGGCVHDPVNCDDGNPCTVDRCNPVTGACEHAPVNCDDGDPCTADSCDPASGQCVHVPVDCDDQDPCTLDRCEPVGCSVPDSGQGTASLPPEGCGYFSPADLHRIIDGLPPGTTIEVAAQHAGFINITRTPGGSLGGEVERFDSKLDLSMSGTGGLAGFDRLINVQAACETHTAPRTPGDPVQSFDTDMFALQGQLPPGDPDFDLLRLTAGTGFGLPSPGHTTLTQRADGTWAVDSFFDITYRIDFVGAPGGPLAGMSGSTTGTIRMSTTRAQCVHTPVNCDDQNPCTLDRCNPVTGACEHAPVSCDDGDPCTADSCDPASGQCVHVPVNCDDQDPCTLDRCEPTGCSVPDNGGGTATLPPAGCGYVSPSDLHEIIDGLPPGTTIQVAAIHKNFICPSGGGGAVCSFAPPVPGSDCDEPGGTLGGEKECADSILALQMTGTGGLAFNRAIDVPVSFETHTAPRTPGDPVQSFDTDMFRLFGQITGDPDFDLLRIVAGTDFGLPSPGHTTLTQQAGGTWAVDSFFDITYRIDFVGRPGGTLSGMSGSTTATVRMSTATGQCVHIPVNCDDQNACTLDRCNPETGACEHAPVSCDDQDPCTLDRCDPTGCTVPDNGGGTANLPPDECGYVSPADLHRIIDGLPPGTTIEVAARHAGFTNITRSPGGSLGGEVEKFDSKLELNLTGTGGLAGFNRMLTVPILCETHTGPRTPGDPVQSFPTDMFALQGQLPPGDPDFDLLRITAGTAFGMPSPGHTTLTQQAGGTWAVDSFFDITYRIDFVGAPGGPLAGMSGSTTATIRMSTAAAQCVHIPVNCDDQNPCTLDRCNPATGACEHVPVPASEPNPIMGSQPALTTARFDWPATPDATHYNNYRGTIPPNLLGSRPPASRYDHACFESDDAFGDGATTTVDPGAVPLGWAFYYFESGESACGESDLGRPSTPPGGTVPNATPCPTPP
jgi:hypothetical protein